MPGNYLYQRLGLNTWSYRRAKRKESAIINMEIPKWVVRDIPRLQSSPWPLRGTKMVLYSIRLQWKSLNAQLHSPHIPSTWHSLLPELSRHQSPGILNKGSFVGVDSSRHVHLEMFIASSLKESLTRQLLWHIVSWISWSEKFPCIPALPIFTFDKDCEHNAPVDSIICPFVG